MRVRVRVRVRASVRVRVRVRVWVRVRVRVRVMLHGILIMLIKLWFIHLTGRDLCLGVTESVCD